MPLDLSLQTLKDTAEPGEPRQVRLYRLLKDAILDGRLAPGTRLPGTRQVAADHGMARNCVVIWNWAGSGFPDDGTGGAGRVTKIVK